MPRLNKFNKRKKSSSKESSNKKMKNLTDNNHSNVDDLIYNSSSTSKEDDLDILERALENLDDSDIEDDIIRNVSLGDSLHLEKNLTSLTDFEGEKKDHCLEGIDVGLSVNNLSNKNVKDTKLKLKTKAYSSINDKIKEFYVGLMERICPFCKAKFFENERMFICCRNGDIKLEKFPDPPSNLVSLYRNESDLSRNFKQNIRNINCCFSFTSMGESRFQHLKNKNSLDTTFGG